MNKTNIGFDIANFVKESEEIVLIEEDFEEEKVRFKSPIEAFTYMSDNSRKKELKIIYMKSKKSVIKSIQKKRHSSKSFKKMFFDKNVKIKYIGEPNVAKAKGSYISNRIIDIILNKKNGFFIGSSKEIVIDKYKSRLESRKAKRLF